MISQRPDEVRKDRIGEIEMDREAGTETGQTTQEKSIRYALDIPIGNYPVDDIRWPASPPEP